MDRGAWPFFVDGVICLVISVSVCEEKKKREDEREKKREDERENERETEERDETRLIFSKKKYVSRPSNPPDELAQHVSKKNPRRTNYSSIFSAKVQNLTVFSFIYMIRIRFFGPGELNQKVFLGAQYWKGIMESERMRFV